MYGTLLSGLSLALLSPLAAAIDAPEITNPKGVQYEAKVKAKGVDLLVTASTPKTGPGVDFAININGNASYFMTEENYIYHIHDAPVPQDGNCTKTLAHLDPYARGESPICDPDSPETCQTGDLSGKYGAIRTLPGFSENYTDPFLSLTSGEPSFLGNRSFVLHLANKTRIACANFELVKKSNATANTTKPSGSGTKLPAGPTSTGGAGASSTSDSKAIRVLEKASIFGPVVFGVAMALV